MFTTILPVGLHLLCTFIYAFSDYNLSTDYSRNLYLNTQKLLVLLAVKAVAVSSESCVALLVCTMS